MSEVYGDARYIVASVLDLSCVESNTDLQAELEDGISDCCRTLDCPSGTVECGEYSVAGSLHEMPTESSKLSIDCPIVLFEAFSPGAIAERTFGMLRGLEEKKFAPSTATAKE